jgi:hypothetical protein
MRVTYKDQEELKQWLLSLSLEEQMEWVFSFIDNVAYTVGKSKPQQLGLVPLYNQLAEGIDNITSRIYVTYCEKKPN